MITRLLFISFVFTNSVICQSIAFSHQATGSDQFLARLAKKLKLDLRAIIAAEYFKYSGDADTNRFLSSAVCTAKRTCLHVSSDRQRDYFVEMNDTTQEQILFLGFVWHPKEYQLYFSWLASGKRGSVRSLGKLLHLDFQHRLNEVYTRLSDGEGPEDFPRNAVITYQQVNFAGDSLNPSDYLVQLDEPTFNSSCTLTLAFVKRSNKYNLAFERLGAGGAAASPVLIDVDSDGREEILIEADDLGKHGSRKTVTIWRYRPQRFTVIFHQGLTEDYGFFPYGYENKYFFVRNSSNPRLLDIAYKISTSIDEIDPELLRSNLVDSATVRRYRLALADAKQVQDSVTFVFDGMKYVAQRRFPDYRRPFRRMYPEIKF